MSKSQPGPRGGHDAGRSDLPPGTWQGRLRLWIEISGHGTLGPGKLRLLEQIGITRSLSAAARKLGMSYRLAWQHLKFIEQRTGITVVEPHRGGRSGGGTDLTAEGEELLAAYRAFRTEIDEHMQAAFARHFAGWSGSRSGQTPES